MKDVLRFAWLHLVHAFRRWQLAHAREFRGGLEETIAHERARARRLVEESELQERRAYALIVAARSDQRRIPADTAHETR